MPKRSKRIEINERIGSFRARLSRTSGASVSASPFKGITLNSKHGARVSKTYKGMTLGFQNLNNVVRGRWSSKDGKVNLNVSKSGFSVSLRNSFGVLNLKNPKRSSASFLGIQVRGQFAAIIALIGFVFDLTIFLIKAGLKLCYILVLLIGWGINIAYRVTSLFISFLIFLTFDFPKQISNKKKEEI